MKKAVIFDMDGVLVETNFLHYSSWKNTFDQYGIPFDENDYQEFLGLSRNSQMELIVKKKNLDLDLATQERIMYEKNILFQRQLSNWNHTNVSDDVWEVVKELKKRSVKMALASSSANARLIMKKTGLLCYFDYISDVEKVKQAKPDPEIFLKAWEGLGFDKKECLIVEDAPNGIEAALAAGIDVCGLSTAYFYERTTFPILNIKEVLNYI